MFELSGLASQAFGAPEMIDAAPLGDGHQPRCRVLRDAGCRPLLQRGNECVLRQVLSERQIATTLGISEGSVKSAASRGLDRLERLLVRLENADAGASTSPDDHPFPGANR